MLPLLDSDKPLPDDPTGAWTQYGANGANTFSVDVSAPPQGNLAWTSDAFTRWRPAVADGTVYTTNFDPSNDGSAIALDAQDGTEQWRTTLDASGDNVIVVVDDRCVVAYDEELVALDSQTGKRIWTVRINGFEQLVADEATRTVLVASDKGIEAFQAADGERLWETNTIRQLVHAPAVSDGRVVAVGDVDGSPSLAAFSLEDGSDHWQSDLTATPESAAPVATPDEVIVSDDRTLVVYDKETGNQRRELGSFGEDAMSFLTQSPLTTGLYSLPARTALSQSTVKPERYDGTAILRNTNQGSVSEPTRSYSRSVSLNLRLGKKTISAFDRKSGEMRWYYGFDPGFHHQVTSPPVMVDGAVFFTATNIDGLGALGDVPERDS